MKVLVGGADVICHVNMYLFISNRVGADEGFVGYRAKTAPNSNPYNK